MEVYLIYLNNAFTSLSGEEFKLLYFIVMSMASEDADALEISIGYLMDVMVKSERSIKRLIKKLEENDFITYTNGQFRLNEELLAGVIAETEDEDPKPKRVGFV